MMASIDTADSAGCCAPKPPLATALDAPALTTAGVAPPLLTTLEPDHFARMREVLDLLSASARATVTDTVADLGRLNASISKERDGLLEHADALRANFKATLAVVDLQARAREDSMRDEIARLAAANDRLRSEAAKQGQGAAPHPSGNLLESPGDPATGAWDAPKPAANLSPGSGSGSGSGSGLGLGGLGGGLGGGSLSLARVPVEDKYARMAGDAEQVRAGHAPEATEGRTDSVETPGVAVSWLGGSESLRRSELHCQAKAIRELETEKADTAALAAAVREWRLARYTGAVVSTRRCDITPAMLRFRFLGRVSAEYLTALREDLTRAGLDVCAGGNELVAFVPELMRESDCSNP
jgi:hypothetical protein